MPAGTLPIPMPDGSISVRVESAGGKVSRHVLIPGLFTDAVTFVATDVSGEPANVRDAAAVVWTADLIAAWKLAHPWIDPPPAPAVVAHLNGGALIRFSATAPITIFENLGMAGVSRLAKGRYRITHQVPMPTDQYSVFPDVMDIAVKYVRYTARTTDFVEVRVVDATGAAADATEVSVKIERVIAS